MARLIFIALCLACIYVDTSKSDSCPVNEHPAPCGKSCEATCYTRAERPCLNNFLLCPMICRCNEGLFRKFWGGKCVTEDRC